MNRSHCHCKEALQLLEGGHACQGHLIRLAVVLQGKESPHYPNGIKTTTPKHPPQLDHTRLPKASMALRRPTDIRGNELLEMFSWLGAFKVLQQSWIGPSQVEGSKEILAQVLEGKGLGDALWRLANTSTLLNT